MQTVLEGRDAGGTAVPPKVLREELLVVLALSLLADAVFAIINLTSAPIRGVEVALFPQVSLPRQLASIAFGLAPVWLVAHVLRRSGQGVGAIGLALDRPSRDALQGAGLAAVVGAAGLGLYLGSVWLGVNRIVVPVPPLGHWWTIPVLILGSARTALLEEVIAVGYLITRLGHLGWSGRAAVSASALLRGSYHLFQGWGGFVGNLALGALFGWIFLRTRRTWPLVVAHFLLDVGAGVLYILFRDLVPGV